MYSQFWKMTSDALLMADENWFKAAKGGFGDALGMSVDGQSQAASPSQYPRPERRRPADIDTELKKGVVIEEMEEEDGAETDVKMEDVGEDLGEDIESKKDK
ncbi:uncharacterized protein LOC102806933 [Saccoglossus kowalevskii]|uniref:ATP-dependent RNA helicase DRS1-like n=1 Tax=Saccoglossus kowalevskii TaxID=10224 RepID=A0ABM0MUY7_SACKO|nr:PREDICTED: ATP-dependent RNA helicase DRS1-like [Saccoglossus kowalevskii]